MQETRCDDCGEMIKPGCWPFCHGDPAKHVPARNFGDQPMEPYLDHNITSEPEGKWITTRGERRRIMEKDAIEYRKHVSKPGGTLYFDMSK